MYSNIYLCYIEWVSEVAQLCPTLCNPVDCNLPGSSVHGILQARILEWVAISFSICVIYTTFNIFNTLIFSHKLFAFDINKPLSQKRCYSLFFHVLFISYGEIHFSILHYLQIFVSLTTKLETGTWKFLVNNKEKHMNIVIFISINTPFMGLCMGHLVYKS